MAVMRLIMIIRAVIMINPKKVEEYFRWSKNRISSADEIAKLTFARPPLSTTPYPDKACLEQVPNLLRQIRSLRRALCE